MTTSAETVGVYGVMKSGWLHRQSDFLRRWKRSFCVLHRDGRFNYYTNETQREVEGTLNLRNCYAIKLAHQVGETPPSNHSTDSLFEVKTPENIIVFCADSSDDAQAWKISIDEARDASAPSGNTTTYYASAPPAYAPAYTAAAPPPYTPTANQTVTTTTTYPNGRRVMVQQTGAQTATYNGVPSHNGLYPTQTSAYSYPGQTVYTTYGAPATGGTIPGQRMPSSFVDPVPNQPTLVPSQPRLDPQFLTGFHDRNLTHTHQTVIYDQRRRNDGFATGAVAGAAVGSMMMMPLLFW